MKNISWSILPLFTLLLGLDAITYYVIGITISDHGQNKEKIPIPIWFCFRDRDRDHDHLPII